MSTLRACLLLLAAAGCGDLSNDDLLFLAAVPSRSEVALEVQGGGDTAGGLTADQIGGTQQYRAEAMAEADWINATVGRLLDFVTALGQSSPPSSRTDDTRVWGPVKNVGGEGLTVRLQIEREERSGGGPRYNFCLHMGRDGDTGSGEVSCANAQMGGLYSVMSGTYEPIANEGARSGSGTILIDFGASERVGASSTGQSGTFTLEYDFTGGGESKLLHVLWSDFASLGTAPTTLDYFYDRDPAGLVHFSFQAYADIIDGDGIERQTVDACWLPNGAGRARVQVRGGDVVRGTAAVASECWDTAQTTYYRFFASTDSPQNVESGNAATCPGC